VVSQYGETLGQGYRFTRLDAESAGRQIQQAHARDMTFANEVPPAARCPRNVWHGRR